MFKRYIYNLLSARYDTHLAFMVRYPWKSSSALSFLDFTKSFDRIGHNVLIVKLIDLGVRRSRIVWIINFLSNRRQRVKLGETFSNWLSVNAGVPQGTKLGPKYC